jgi:hypothetical protein
MSVLKAMETMILVLACNIARSARRGIGLVAKRERLSANELEQQSRKK